MHSGGAHRQQWPTALGHVAVDAYQQPAIGGDRLVTGAEMFLRAVLNRPHRFHRPLVVHVDVVAYARKRGVLPMLVNSATRLVALVGLPP